MRFLSQPHNARIMIHIIEKSEAGINFYVIIFNILLFSKNNQNHRLKILYCKFCLES